MRGGFVRLFAAVLCLWASASYALTQCTQWTAYQNPTESQWVDKPTALAQWQSLNPSTCSRTNFVSTQTGYTYSYQCGCCETGTGSIALASRTGAYCSACLIAAGTESTRNVTYGYAGRPPVPGGTAYLDFLPSGAPNTGGGIPNPPGGACISLCWHDLVSEGGDIWASSVPTASGLYRVSRDVTYKSVGSECVPTEGNQQAIDQGVDPPSCQGSAGYIGDKKVCLPSVPDSGLKSPYPPADKAYTEGNPKAGSKSDDPINTRIPATGGNGGNFGGPPGVNDGRKVFPGGVIMQPSASAPTSATKTATAGEEQVACGAPGQPKCALDETGTPSNRDLKLDEAAINTQAQINRNTASGSADKGMFSTWSSFFVTPTVGTCGPLQLPGALSQSGVVIDPCPVVDGTRSVVGFLWALGGFWLCLGWIREVI